MFYTYTIYYQKHYYNHFSTFSKNIFHKSAVEENTFNKNTFTKRNAKCVNNKNNS